MAENTEENMMDPEVTDFLTKELKFDEDTSKKFEEMGIRSLSDFSEMDEADLNKLKLNKFERRRFLKGLQRTVPNFIFEKPIKELAKQMSNMQPIPQKKDEVLAWLETAKLEKYSGKLNSQGIKCMEDVAYLEDEDIDSLGMNKFEQNRFMKLMGNVPNASVAQSDAPSITQQGFASSSRSSVAAASMANSSKHALATCAMPSAPSDTLDLFYDNWRTVRSVNRK